jgi:hypothetical protein
MTRAVRRDPSPSGQALCNELAKTSTTLVRGGTCLLFARGNCLAHGPEQFVTPRCLADHQLQVLRKKITFVDQALSLLPHLFEVPCSAWVAFLDRPAGVTLRRAFLASRRERDRRQVLE